MRKHALLGWSGQVSVAKKKKHLQYSGSVLVAIQPLPSFNHVLTLSHTALI